MFKTHFFILHLLHILVISFQPTSNGTFYLLALTLYCIYVF